MEHTHAIVSYNWRAYDVTVLVKNTPTDIERAKRAIKKSIAKNYRVKQSELEFYDDSYKVDTLNVASSTKKIYPSWV